MKTIIRNFLSVLRRFKLATVLNVAGLTVAFTAFMVILMQVRYEYTYDTFHSTSDRVYRVDIPDSYNPDFSIIHSRPVVEAVIHSSPHIKSGTLIFPYMPPVYFTVEENGERRGFKESVITVHPEFLDVFDFRILQGDRNALKEPGNAIIPAGLARKMFGTESALGKVLHAEESIQTKSRDALTIGAIYEDLPGNSQFRNVIYSAIDPDESMSNSMASNFMLYVLLDRPESRKVVEDNFNNNPDYMELIGKAKRADAFDGIELVPLTDIYFKSGNYEQSIVKGGNRESTLILLGVAFLVIIIAAINYTNFSTALAPLRVRSINTQKVLGGQNSTLRISLLMEGILICMLSFLLSLLLLSIFERTHAMPFLQAGIQLSGNGSILGGTAVIALLVGVIAGLYPSWYITSFPPALALKGNAGLTPKGRRLRTALIGFQFVVSVVLIIASSFVQIQRQFMKHYNVGFDKDQIAVIELGPEVYKNNGDAFVEKLKSFPGIEDVAFSAQKVGSQDQYSTSTFVKDDMSASYFTIPVSHSFFKVMGIPVIDGREPLPGDGSELPKFYFNRKMKERFDLKSGTSYSMFPGAPAYEVLGFTEEVRLASLRRDDSNVAYLFAGSIPLSVCYIRLTPMVDYYRAVNHIRTTVAEMDPGYPVQVEFYDEIFNQLYQKEESLNKMVTLFSLLAIIISIVGVFGLVVFETQFRRKEISIRKVMGAEVRDILVMFNKVYLHIVTICFVIAAPIAYFFINKWLENFAHKTPVYWWVFVLSFIVVALITVITVSFQNWQAANENPVESIKAE